MAILFRWECENTTAEVAGGDNSATLVGSAVISADQHAVGVYSLKKTGTYSGAQFTAVNDINFTQGRLGFWLYYHTAVSGQLILNCDYGDADNMFIRFSGTGGVLQYYFISGGTEISITSNGNVPADTWTWIEIKWDTTLNQYQMWFNTTSQGTSTIDVAAMGTPPVLLEFGYGNSDAAGEFYFDHILVTDDSAYTLYQALGNIEPEAARAVCNKINPLIGPDPYLLASIFRQFPSQELEDYEFEDDQQRDPLYWVEDQRGLATDDIIEDFFEYSGIPEPLVILPAAINAVCTKVDPTIPAVTLYITPAARSVIGSRNNPVIRLYITPVAINAIGSRDNPSILVTPPLAITPTAINAISASVNPTVLIPVMVIPVAVYVMAGKINPVIQLYVTPDAIYTVTRIFDPNVPLNTIAGYSLTGGIDPYILVTPPVVISFEMWRDAITIAIDPYVLINPLLPEVIPAYTVGHVVNPYVYVLGGTEYVLPDAASVIVISVDPEIVSSLMQILELVSRISTMLELASIIKTELNLDSNISTLLELESVIPERMLGGETPPTIEQHGFDIDKFDEDKFE